MAHQTPDEVAKSLGFPSAAAMMAWQQRQQQIQQLPAQTMPQRPAKPQPQPHPTESWLDTILSYLPLGGAMQKAEKAMDKR